jgi:hypothetical protein
MAPLVAGDGDARPGARLDARTSPSTFCDVLAELLPMWASTTMTAKERKNFGVPIAS